MFYLFKIINKFHKHAIFTIFYSKTIVFRLILLFFSLL